MTLDFPVYKEEDPEEETLEEIEKVLIRITEKYLADVKEWQDRKIKFLEGR